MILYFLKTILLLGAFYTLYTLFLKNEKTFRFNRMYLVLTSLLTVVLPFINAISFAGSKETVQQSKTVSFTLDAISVYAGAVSTAELDFGRIILGIYFAGLLWGVLRVALGFLVIHRIRQQAVIEKYEDQRVYFNAQIESPFSFNKHIFIPDSFKDKPVLQSVLQHETAHLKMLHSRDKILFSFLQALLWFNPFVYLCHKELELIHEFEADDFTTKKIATDDYVQNLLQTISYKQTPTLLVHQFFHHPLKTRITMLYKKFKNALVQKSVVSTATLFICIFTILLQGTAQHRKVPQKTRAWESGNDTNEVRNPDGTFNQIISVKNSAFDCNDHTVYEVADEMPEFPDGQEALLQYISANIKYPHYEAKNKIEGKVLVNFTVDRDGTVRDVRAARTPPNGEALASEAIRVVARMPKWKPGRKDGLRVHVRYSLPVDFRLK